MRRHHEDLRTLALRRRGDVLADEIEPADLGHHVVHDQHVEHPPAEFIRDEDRSEPQQRRREPRRPLVDAERQERDENSPLNYFRWLVRFRKENLALIYGKSEFFDLENESVFAYTRELDDKKLLILLNFTEKPAKVNVPFDLSGTKYLFGNYADFDRFLKPYQGVILET